MGINLIMALVVIGGLFYGGWQAASIYHKGKQAAAIIAAQEDQSKKTKAGIDTSVILNDFGNDEQKKSDEIADRMQEEVTQNEQADKTPTTSRPIILDAKWLRDLSTIR